MPKDEDFEQFRFKKLDLGKRSEIKKINFKIAENLDQARRLIVDNPEELAPTYRLFIIDDEQINAFVFQDQKEYYYH